NRQGTVAPCGTCTHRRMKGCGKSWLLPERRPALPFVQAQTEVLLCDWRNARGITGSPPSIARCGIPLPYDRADRAVCGSSMGRKRRLRHLCHRQDTRPDADNGKEPSLPDLERTHIHLCSNRRGGNTSQATPTLLRVSY